MRKICLMTTGGTIASKLEAESGHVTASVTGSELRAMLHDPLDGIDIAIDEFCNVGSYAIDLPLGFALAQRISHHLQGDFDGVVVTHGTDTMEESAFLADLLVATDKPIVFTGAQHAADEANPDGPRNLTDAIRLAASETARGLGAMICFEQEFHAARDVSKSHSSRTDTFISYEHGKLGEVDGDRIVLHRKPVLRRTYDAKGIVADVDLIKLVMGMGDRYIRFAAQDGAKAIILEGFGRGNATPAVTAAATSLVANGTPVIMTSRCQRGRVKPIYGNGGGKTLSDGGVIFAGDLSGQKARVLVAVLLGMGIEGERLRQEIEYFGG
ncbi:asparaginase [Mesorhizobium sp. B2-1-5]|uniref:asparaginase n=1 Tax=Mesorhizobium sp. B2-1-5 TaxID=2589969 RepID=UPI0011292F9D|nr:asparaginase [Mesorhizobium sp. B2-1-5]TPM98525.1 asparaginase [Mesorhizobium sp. B2-1-5]